jgi:hypothetical protein
MLDYDPVTSIQKWPMPNMGRFGKNPYGEDLYRVVWAPSRRHIVYGEWRDGSVGAKWVRLPSTREMGNIWIVERWRSIKEMGVERDSDWHLAAGIPPSRGEYVVCYQFENGLPSDISVEKVIGWDIAGRNAGFGEKQAACQADYEESEREQHAAKMGMIYERLPAFGTAPMVGFGGGRGTKTIPMPKGIRRDSVQKGFRQVA